MSKYRTSVLLLLCTLGLITECHGVCQPFSEHYGGIFFCNYTLGHSADILYLKAGSPGHMINVAYCSRSGCTDVYNTYISSSRTQVGNRLDATFTVHSLSRASSFNMETNWGCALNNAAVDIICNPLLIYAAPSGISCHLPQYVGTSKSQLQLRCETEKVYPQAACTFGVQYRDGSRGSSLGSVTYNHSRVSDSPVYYSTVCTLTVSLSKLSTSPWLFHSRIYPKLPGSTIYGAYTIYISLAHPSAALDLDCPQGEVKDGYIKSGTVAYCRCVVTTPGYPAGQSEWSTQGHFAVTATNGSDGSSLLTIQEPAQLYICQVKSFHGTSVSVSLLPKFANAVENSSVITLQKEEGLGPCCSDDQLVSVSCQVPASEIRPYPVFKMLLNNVSLTTFQNGSLDSGVYKYNFMIRRAFRDGFVLTCVVANGLFPDLAAEVQLQIDPSDTEPVYPFLQLSTLPLNLSSLEPERNYTPTLLKIDDFFYARLQCVVVDSDHFEAGNELSTNSTTPADELGMGGIDTWLRCLTDYPLTPIAIDTSPRCRLQILQLDFNMNGSTENVIGANVSDEAVAPPCNAPASENNCTDVPVDQYNLTVYFQVVYGPKVVSFLVDGNATVVTDPSSAVSLDCEVEGVPRATALIQGTGLGQLDQTSADSALVHLLIEDLQCEDSGRYVCKADNGRAFELDDSEGFVDINIPCEMKITHQQTDGKPQVFSFSPDGRVLVTVETYGYPDPTEYVLKVERGTTYQVVSTDHYSVSYTRLIPPFGEVKLDLSSESNDEPWSNYILTVKNGIGGGLDFKFEVQNPATSSKKPSDDSLSTTYLGIGLGLGLALALLCAAVVAGCCCCRRQRYSVLRGLKRAETVYDRLAGRKRSHQTERNENVYNIPLSIVTEQSQPASSGHRGTELLCLENPASSAPEREATPDSGDPDYDVISDRDSITDSVPENPAVTTLEPFQIFNPCDPIYSDYAVPLAPLAEFEIRKLFDKGSINTYERRSNSFGFQMQETVEYETPRRNSGRLVTPDPLQIYTGHKDSPENPYEIDPTEPAIGTESSATKAQRPSESRGAAESSTKREDTKATVVGDKNARRVRDKEGELGQFQRCSEYISLNDACEYSNGRIGLDNADGEDGLNNVDGESCQNNAEEPDGPNNADREDGPNNADRENGLNNASGEDALNNTGGGKGPNNTSGEDGPNIPMIDHSYVDRAMLIMRTSSVNNTGSHHSDTFSGYVSATEPALDYSDCSEENDRDEHSMSDFSEYTRRIVADPPTSGEPVKVTPGENFDRRENRRYQDHIPPPEPHTDYSVYNRQIVEDVPVNDELIRGRTPRTCERADGGMSSDHNFPVASPSDYGTNNRQIIQDFPTSNKPLQDARGESSERSKRPVPSDYLLPKELSSNYTTCNRHPVQDFPKTEENAEDTQEKVSESRMSSDYILPIRSRSDYTIYNRHLDEDFLRTEENSKDPQDEISKSIKSPVSPDNIGAKDSPLDSSAAMGIAHDTAAHDGNIHRPPTPSWCDAHDATEATENPYTYCGYIRNTDSVAD